MSSDNGSGSDAEEYEVFSIIKTRAVNLGDIYTFFIKLQWYIYSKLYEETLRKLNTTYQRTYMKYS